MLTPERLVAVGFGWIGAACLLGCISGPFPFLLQHRRFINPGQTAGRKGKPAEQSVFKIEVFDALQTRFGPSKCNPKWKRKTSFELVNIICPPQEPTSVGECRYKK